MKSLRLLLVLLSPMLFFACSKEKSFEAGSGTTINSQWEFTEGSRLFKGPVDTAFLTRISNVNSLIVEGTSDDGTGLLTIAVIGINTSSPGVYKSPAVVFDYSNNQGSIYQNDITAVGQFTVEITKIDSAGVTGTFSGQAKDTNGVLKPITSGKFSAKFGAAVIPPGTAQMTFWSKSSCSAGGNINVTLTNSQTGSISSFTATAPACGAAGTASFNVPPGTYGWLAKCGTDSTAGVITLAANQCVKQEVVLGSATPTGEATFWAKSSCTAGGNISVKLSNNQTGIITSFNATAPASCTAAGNANFNLPVGSYTWVAKCGTDSITGNLSIVASQCAKVEVQFPTGTAAQYALVSAGGNCSNIQVNGTYIAGKPLGPDTNTVVIQVNVTAIGSYTISTNNVNGYSFSASGSFASTGVQNVTLKGAGTPTAAGTNNFTVTASASTCNFPVTVIAAPVTTVNSWSFTQGTRNFSGTLPFGSDFGIDALSIGKALEMNGEIPNTDTAIFIYIQFPSSATAPVPGTYTTNPDWGSNNLTDFYFYDFNEDIYYVKDFPPLPPTTPVLTFTVTSYDATTKIVKGTFTGNAWNSVGTIVPITNGKFEAVVNF